MKREIWYIRRISRMEEIAEGNCYVIERGAVYIFFNKIVEYPDRYELYFGDNFVCAMMKRKVKIVGLDIVKYDNNIKFVSLDDITS